MRYNFFALLLSSCLLLVVSTTRCVKNPKEPAVRLALRGHTQAHHTHTHTHALCGCRCCVVFCCCVVFAAGCFCCCVWGGVGVGRPPRGPPPPWGPGLVGPPPPWAWGRGDATSQSEQFLFSPSPSLGLFQESVMIQPIGYLYEYARGHLLP